ncbi:hypothetical protein HII31_12722 [Pseudocercospora fuligena]|uniref:DUF4246 domain-containing protein n=1 Tax=Pseudocercospora fuligena TaxID=685502 RepID=A0A8H6VF37_9PEZI|nr:hypothetical protein HII31_12722 [Pseudocercospora fuligena]
MAEATTNKTGRGLHGFGKPVNAISGASRVSSHRRRCRFSNAISDHNGEPLMLKERNMIALMDKLTDKPDWNRKINEEDIVSKWRAECAELEKTFQPEQAVTQKMFDYCIEELRNYAKQFELHGFVPAIDAERTVYKSDVCISDELKAQLKSSVASLEDLPKDQKDWHPDSDEKVLDLVHPSLYPLVYGRSQALLEGTVPLEGCEKYIGKGVIVPVPEKEHLQVKQFSGLSTWRSGEQHFYSSRFQWLPCEVAFGENETVKITSYINNLHPIFHQPVYEVLEQIIAKTVPMWNAALSDDGYHLRSPRLAIDGVGYDEPEGERPPAENEDELDEDEIDELNDAWQRANRVLTNLPEPGSYSMRVSDHEDKKETAVDLRKDFSDRGLQVIVKLANIHLTPEKPTYGGGAWHIEGQLNEHICASAIYYYDNDNITESHLSFREFVSVDELTGPETDYEQDDYDHILRLYGIEQNGPAIQTLGKVNTKEGRLITFPNVLQHKVEPFELADKTKPGHRKILALFLVDPYLRIPSTAHVPPQQKNWWRAMVLDLDRVTDLPAELAERVVDSEHDLISMDEAKALRLELMAERKLFVQDVDKRYHEEEFSFCEH